jgi:chemotaxis protein methyltransferase CheR
VKPAYRRGVAFRVGNLLRDEAYGAAGSYDVIFCRNVLIYFPEEMILCALERFHRALRPGGLLFLGHSESIIGMSTPFEPARIGRCIAYRRGEGS